MAEVPEHILRRSAEARAKAEGRDVDEVLAEMKGEAPPAESAPAAPPPAAAEPASAAEPAAAAAPAPSGNGGVDIAALSAQTGVPEHILLRATRARAKAEGRPDPTVAAPAAGGGTAVATAPAPATAAAPAAAAQVVPEGVRTQRLLTVVKAGAIQQVKREPTDKVNVWPHLLAIEFVALLTILLVLTVMSIFIEAPLLELANFNEQPNPSKAPWYFLGLQEMLSYFDPMVAGVLVPTFGLIALMIVPYVDRTPSSRPADRKLAIMIFTFFVISASILTIFGSFFRGPGFNFVFPWRDGIFFDDLLEVLE